MLREAPQLSGRVPGCAVECSTSRCLISSRYDDRRHEIHKTLFTPWQSVGAKAVTTLAAKLMLALLPPQTTFFKTAGQ